MYLTNYLYKIWPWNTPFVMENGTICQNDYNCALQKIYDAIKISNPEDTWMLETPDESSSPELICNHFCTIYNTPARLEYRITYSDAYSVPILMFRGSLKDGEPVPISYFWNFLSKNSSSQSGMLNVLSQIEHRQLGVPYFFIHPCKTKDFMADVSPSSPTSYISLWLSLMAHCFGISVPMSIGKIV